MDPDLWHLAQTDRHIAELRKHIALQRIIVQAAIRKGRPSPEAESYLEVLESSLRTFERHRGVILRFIENSPPQIKLIECAEGGEHAATRPAARRERSGAHHPAAGLPAPDS